ncbi:hypothetical protein T09_15463 [Trichinella sp. T9]|nr:hypothetical protein T09_15463 [Trichinella sp. T9]
MKEALLAAFAADPFVAYDQFVSRRLGPDESPDVFLAELRMLATLFGGVSEKALACAFVAGLPENVCQLLRAGSRMEDFGLSQILTRARAIITDERPRLPDGASSAADQTISPEIVWLDDRMATRVGRTRRLATDVGAVEASSVPLHIRETSSGQKHQRQPSVPATIDRGAARCPYERRWHTTPRAGRHGVLSVCCPCLVLPKTKASVRIRDGSRPCEVRVQQGKRINPRAAAVAEATRSWTGARLCGDRGSGRGANDRRCPSCHGPPGNKTNVVLCKANQDLDALCRHLAARCCLPQGHATLTCHYLRPA